MALQGVVPQIYGMCGLQMASLVGFGYLLRAAEFYNPTVAAVPGTVAGVATMNAAGVGRGGRLHGGGLHRAVPTGAGTVEIWQNTSTSNLFLAGSAVALPNSLVSCKQSNAGGECCSGFCCAGPSQ